MPSTGYAGLRYPALDDTNINQATLDLLSDIEFRNNVNVARLAELKRTRGCWVKFAGSTNLASSATVVVTYTSEVIDTDNYVNLAVSNTNITLPKGLFLITASTLMTCSTAINSSQMELLFGGSVYASHSNGVYSGGNSIPNSLSVLYRATGSTILTVQVTQVNGSATLGHLAVADVQVARIGIL